MIARPSCDFADRYSSTCECVVDRLLCLFAFAFAFATTTATTTTILISQLARRQPPKTRYEVGQVARLESLKPESAQELLDRDQVAWTG